MTTDAEGRYTVRGLGRELEASFAVHDAQFALQSITVRTNEATETKPATAALIPAQTITGRVTYADTGNGVPHAPLEVRSSTSRNYVLVSSFETDAEGRYRINPPPADRSYGITAFPPEGQPYLIAVNTLEWPKGALERSLDVALPRGVLVHGKVTEEGSGNPVAGATVEFCARGQRNSAGQDASIIIETAADGSFGLGVKPAPGYLMIRSPSDVYVLQEIGYRMIQEGEPGGIRMYAHAHRLLDLKPGDDSEEVNIVLRRGATAAGEVVAPDGQPMHDALIWSRVILDQRPAALRSWDGQIHVRAHNGHFEIHGLDPDGEVPVVFLDPSRKLGAVVSVSGKSAAGRPLNVRLEPCGAARARFVNPGGKPVTGSLPRETVVMVVTPGPTYSQVKEPAGKLTADERDLSQIDTVNYQPNMVADAQGRLTLPVLIPGATYRVIDSTTIVRGQTGPQIRKEFTVKPGETLDLGDILIEKPRIIDPN